MELCDVLDPRDPAPTARDAARTWLALQRELALRPQQAASLLAQDPGAALARYRKTSRDGAEDLALLARLGVRGLPLLSPRYPERLRRLADPAPLLWVQGSLEALAAPCVAVVGPRAPTSYGRLVARALARALAGAGLAVVSGLARGVDAEAHAGALEAGGLTVAFQACGPDLVYPAVHRDLAARIAARGALVSELPPGTPPLAPHFPLRNRLISGLSLAVVVVEARERSGSLVTARHAAEQGVDVLAVPGPIDAATSRGTNRLIRDGARMLLDVRDVLEAIGARAARARAGGRGAGAEPLAPRKRDPRLPRGTARGPRRALPPPRATPRGARRGAPRARARRADRRGPRRPAPGPRRSLRGSLREGLAILGPMGAAAGERRVVVVGAGLAGCEAAFQLARRGVAVTLFEMRPVERSPAHQSDDFAELVCSNSLRASALGNAVGLLKEEMRRLGSLVLEAADDCAVPAGRALAVDRTAFARHDQRAHRERSPHRDPPRADRPDPRRRRS